MSLTLLSDLPTPNGVKPPMVTLPVGRDAIENTLGTQFKPAKEYGLGPVSTIFIRAETGQLAILEALDFTPGRTNVWLDSDAQDAGKTCRELFLEFRVPFNEGIWAHELERTAEYDLCRQDDNANVFVVARYKSRLQAQVYAAEFESRSHKQAYFVQRGG
jgi:hypothetical protein